MSMTRDQLAIQKEAKIRKILEAIANHVWRYGYQPTLRELAAIMGWVSPNYVQALLTQHFKENSGGRKRMQSRAIDFDWQRYVTETSLSWHNKQASYGYPAKRAAPKGAAKKQLGRVS